MTKMKNIAPQWIVDSLEETLSFYINNLEFKVDWKGSLFSIISKENVTIMLRQLKEPNLKRPNNVPFSESGWHTNGKKAWDAYIWMDEVDEFYNSVSEKDVEIIKDIQDTDYGNRDFEIKDNNGYIICFGKVL